jgi:trk system potassium uptake protein TrkH
VLRVAADLLLVAGLLSLAPPAVAVLTGEFAWCLPSLVPALLLGTLGLALRRGRSPSRLQAHEALVVTALVFVASPLAAAIPWAMSGIPPVDALFETVSGVTTTGLSTLASVEGLPRTLQFSRAWMQWYGGLGIAVLSLAIVLGHGVASRRLLVTAVEGDDFPGSAGPHARRVLVVYLALTLSGVGVLWALGGDLFDAVVHCLAAVSTGGFAPRDASLAGLDRGFQLGVTSLCVAGAISFPLFARARSQGLRALLHDVELRALLEAAAAAAALLAWIGGAGPTPDAALLALSAQTTAGFSTVDPSELDAAGKLVLIVSMMAGGSVGSTAGGVKLLRILVAFQVARWMLVRTRLPSHARGAPAFAGQPLAAEDVQRALAVIGLFLAAILLSWLPFLVAGHPPLDALFEVASALGTVGLSTGIASPELSTHLKAVLCADMLLGRLEIVALLVALAPRTWIGRRTN